MVGPTEGAGVPIVERFLLTNEYRELGDALHLRFGKEACDRVQSIAQLKRVLAPMGRAHIDLRVAYIGIESARSNARCRPTGGQASSEDRRSTEARGNWAPSALLLLRECLAAKVDAHCHKQQNRNSLRLAPD